MPIGALKTAFDPLPASTSTPNLSTNLTVTRNNLIVFTLNQGGEMHIKHNLGKGAIKTFGLNARLIIALNKRRHQPLAGSKGKIIIDQRIILNIDLCGQFTVIICRHKIMDMGRSITMTAQVIQQLLGRAIGWAAIAMRHNGAVFVPALVIGNDSTTHIKGLLLPCWVKMRIKPFGITVQDLDLCAWHRRPIRTINSAMNDQGFTLIAAIIKAGIALLNWRTDYI